MRLTPNLHVGLVLGIATAGVILALSGCVAGTASSSSPSASPAASRGDAQFEQFSEIERERILAVQAIVSEAASEHGVDPTLINAVIWVESRFEPKAKSPAGARGLMQLMPSTAAYLAKRMGERNPRAYDPEFNVRAGSLYLSQMIAKFGDEQHAVAAYHAGPGNVKRWLETGERFPDYSQNYVAKVMEARARFEGIDGHGRRSGGAAPALAPASTPEREPEPLVVPDVDSLPDAAEIHGVARVVHVRPEPKPEPDPEPQREPVFEIHPELDANPEAPRGWDVAPRRRERAPEAERPAEPRARPQPKTEPRAERRPQPKPQPRNEPEAEPSQPTGLGVLPDL